MANTPGESWQVRFQIHEVDDIDADDHSDIVYTTYTRDGNNWGIGGTKSIYAGGDGPRGYMRFKIEQVD